MDGPPLIIECVMIHINMPASVHQICLTRFMRSCTCGRNCKIYEGNVLWPMLPTCKYSKETFGMISYLYLKVVRIPHLDGCDQVSLHRRMIDYPFHSTQRTPFCFCKVGEWVGLSGLMVGVLGGCGCGSRSGSLPEIRGGLLDSEDLGSSVMFWDWLLRLLRMTLFCNLGIMVKSVDVS